MLDFTSALYLGFLHASRELRPWTQFTTGAPAALTVPEAAGRVARELAALQGLERATLAPSTLHLVWDLFGLLARERPAVFLDDGTYPVARWGVERAAARGARVVRFPHHDARTLRQAVAASRRGLQRTVIVADGFCPACGQAAPVDEYLAAAQEGNGLLVLDDTQALGIFGESPGPNAPYGRGGGGMLRHAQTGGPRAVLVSSLAKAFGVPMAALSGSGAIVQAFEEQSESRTHSSPPSIAALHAAERALERNRREGDAVRLRLAGLVRHFRLRARATGLALVETGFPVQTLRGDARFGAVEAHRSLLEKGIRAVLHRSHSDRGPRLSFLITANHTVPQLERTLEALSAIAGRAAVAVSRGR